MGFRQRGRWVTFLTSTLWLALLVPAAHAQVEQVNGQRRYSTPIDCPPPCPPQLAPIVPPVTGDKKDEVPPATAAPVLRPEEGLAVQADTVALANPNMIGDVLVPSGGRFSTFSRSSTSTSFPTGSSRSVKVVVPAAGRSFKIADNNNPRPQDRIFVTFNYFNNVNEDINRKLGAANTDTQVYREMFGFERTFLDGNASFTMQLPLNTISLGDNGNAGTGVTSTAIGDLTLVLKGVAWDNPQTGSLISGGIAATFPTGPDGFAGLDNVIGSFHGTTLQPFLGAIFGRGDLFVQGFSALSIPTDSEDVTLMFNDIGIGYYLVNNRNTDRMLTAVVPTFEVHINTPLNHRGVLSGPSGTPDWVVLTEGVTFEFNQRALLTFGIATPVTGLKPFDFEGLVQFNLRF